VGKFLQNPGIRPESRSNAATKAAIIVDILRWFPIDVTLEREADDIRRYLSVRTFHPRFSACGMTANTSDAK
jgi:hypothetical protein